MTVNRNKKTLFPCVRPASSLLQFLAGEHAPGVALLWPAPHAGFFGLPTARRHAAAILIANLGADEPLQDARKRNLVEFERDAEVARSIMGEHAPGFMKMLAKMGEPLWTADQYRSLLNLFRDPNANRALRHLQEVSPAQLTPILKLRPILRETHILAHVGGIAAADDLDFAFGLSLRMRGERMAARIADRWNSARNRSRLFEMAVEDLAPDVFRPVIEAPDLPAPFERVTTRKALHALAQEFENCLRDYTDDVARGRMAVYAWRGEKAAAVALIWDAAGWRLAEAESHGNEGLEEHILQAIVKPLAEHNVRTGPALSTIVNRLEQHRRGETVHLLGSTFEERLCLGDLWN